MPTISKIRFTHVIYEGGNKRYNDVIFDFHGHNGAVVLENGGGKTVFIQTAVQAVLPHADLAGRKLKDTLMLDNGPAHIAIEWILNDKPRRRYALTCVTLFQSGNGIDSYRYVNEYGEHDSHSIDQLPFVKEHLGKPRPADKGEIHDYYASMEQRYPLHARTFSTLKEYKSYLEQQFQIITGEWEAIVKINDSEGGIESFFDECKTTIQLFDRLLIPIVEQSIEGYEQGSFAKMFEAHREGFKKYKELREQIDENKRILAELNQYVGLFEKLDAQQRQYNEGRGEAKAYWKLSLEQTDELEAEHNRLLAQLKDVEQRSEQLLRKRRSLAIVRERQERDAIDSKLQLTAEDMDDLAAKLRETEREYYSLQYAESRDRYNTARARIRQLEQQIQRLSYSEDEQALQQRWNSNGAQLRYAFAAKEQELEGLRRQKEGALAQAVEQIRSLEDKRLQLEAEISGKERSMLTKEAEQRVKREQLQQIANSILTNPQLEKVEQQIPLWIEDEQRLEQGRIALLQELKRLEDEREGKERRRKAAVEELGRAERELARLLEQEERQRMDQTELRQQLVGLRPSWERLGSLYERQSSIVEQLTEQVEKLRSQKHQLLMKERLAYRYVDDHGQQELFFADAVVARLSEQWSRQFSLLQTGTDYINGLSAVLGHEEQDRLWAVTLITTALEKTALTQKLAQASGSFAFPIRVLNVLEASNAARGQQQNAVSQGEWIVPEHWRNNEQRELFKEWKAKLAEQAHAVKSERERTEAQAADWQSAQRSFADFLAKYPLAAQQELEQKRLQEDSRTQELRREQDRLEHELAVNRQTEEQRRKAAEEMATRILHVGLWLREGRNYMLLAGEVAKLGQELAPIREQLALLTKQREREQARLEQLLGESDKLTEASRGVALQQQLLQRDERFAEVAACTPEPCEMTIEELKLERKALELERHRIVQEHTQLEAERSREQERERECLKLMEQLSTEHLELVLDMSLPLEVDERKHHMWSTIEELREQKRRVQGEHSRITELLQARNGAIATLERQFMDQYPGMRPDSFQESLFTVEERLIEEEAAQRSEQEQLARQQLQTGKLRKELEQVLGLWNKHMIVHALEDVRLTPAIISEEDQAEFRYNRIVYAERSIGRLQNLHEQLLKERKSVQTGRQRLREYCSVQVKDVKLRQMTLQGVENKERYEELREFQKSMEQRIQMAIHIREQTLQTQDRELQQYIQHIHAHLKLIAQELREIPKKTRVQTDEGWKEIYSFNIPAWEEQEGRERIRKHIDWIMEKLDHYSFEQGHASWQEQQTTIRKDLDKWLDARQLIQVVMLGEGMKVTCRKVTNDQQVTKAAFSWEQSNRWSGGEKWSKNMTLFLGLLNYVAERKQHIQAKMKRHRTVILDNPFGKASSDHVLSPVFFIAEQLGFQMIALTAHVEGKFLQDYFPIVYSCRLRHASDSSKQIVEASQHIQTAYFRDNDPGTLERINSKVSQVEFF